MKGMTDISAGKMTIWQVVREITQIMSHKKPIRLVIDIKRKKGGYYSTFWIPTKRR